jgi:methylamine---glutamate N-methyltransferase subunit C
LITNNKDFWIIFSGISIGLIGSGIFIVFFSLLKAGKVNSALFNTKRLIESINFMRKVNWGHYFETNLRAETGKVLERPFGTPVHYFSWERILFNPVYLSRKPLDADVEIETSVTLGPQAKKPLQLKTPIMIGGMSYGGALSYTAKIALAKASAMAGTATNSGSGPFLEEERAAADKYVFQYSRGFWSKSAAVLNQADMIEIALGHGAWQSAPVRINGQKVSNGYAKRVGTIAGLDILIEARLPEVENQADWKTLIKYLKEVTDGIPIAVKIGGTHYLEKELALILEGGIDVIIVDGTEGGSHSVPAILADDVGLPTLPGLCRAAQYIRDQGLSGKVSLVVGGGLSTPGDFLKCIALGADAVVIGTIASLAMSHTQVLKTIPWEPPTGLIYYRGKEEKKYDPNLGAKHLNDYLQSCIKEMQEVARVLGKKSLNRIEKSDLIVLDPLYAEMTGVELRKTGDRR